MHNFLNPIKQATAGLTELQAPTSCSQLNPQLGFGWESPSPAQVAAISDCFIAQAGWLWAKHVGLYHLGNPRVSAPSGQLQTMLEHHHTAPAQLILHGGWRNVVSGHSQSLQLPSLGKSLSLICQQQPRLNYKRRAYSAHTKGTLQVPSLDDRGGCATGP